VTALVRYTAALVQDVVDGVLPADVAGRAFQGLSLLRQLLGDSDLERRLADLEAQVVPWASKEAEDGSAERSY